jgi:hypothetical protein
MIKRRINYEWLTWGVTSVVGGRLPGDIRSRIDAARTRADALRVVARTIPIAWVDDRSLGARFIGHEHQQREPQEPLGSA